MLETIKQITEEVFNLENIEQRTRKHPYPEARAIYYAVAKERMPKLSYSKIAKYIGRDHSTAIVGIKKLKDTYLLEKKFQEMHRKVLERAPGEISELEMLRRENEELKRKADKWDALSAEISKCYCNACGVYDEENPEEEGADLCTIGEMAASAFGWL